MNCKISNEGMFMNMFTLLTLWQRWWTNYLNFGRYAMHIQHQTLFWIAIHVTIYWLDTPLTIPPICNDITCTKCSYQVSLYYVLWYGSRIVWRHYIKHMPFMYDIDFAVMTYLYLNRCMGLICVLVNGAC